MEDVNQRTLFIFSPYNMVIAVEQFNPHCVVTRESSVEAFGFQQWEWGYLLKPHVELHVIKTRKDARELCTVNIDSFLTLECPVALYDALVHASKKERNDG